MAKPLRDVDVNLLVELEAQLPGLRRNVELARLIASHPTQRSSKHPVINYAFLRAPTAVLDNVCLRTVEALELIQRANAEHGLPRVLENSRDAKPLDSDLAVIWRVRQEIVAHRIRLAPRGYDVAAELNSSPDLFVYYLAALDKLAVFLKALRAKGAFDRVVGTPAPGTPFEFTSADIEELLNVANRLMEQRSDGPGSATA